MTPPRLIATDTIPDLRPTADSGIEWWYVQGMVQGDGVEPHYLMAALFLTRGLDGDGAPGAMLLQHILCPASGRCWVESRVSPVTIDHHDRIARRVVPAGVPPFLQRVLFRYHLSEARREARSHGIVIDQSEPALTDAPFSVAWNGFALGAPGTGNLLTLQVATAGGPKVALDLVPDTAWLDEHNRGILPGLDANFAYQACPRLRAEGTIGGKAVRGNIWLERQWGDYDGWLLGRGRSGYRVIGWEWLGLNLSDGSDILTFVQRDAASGRREVGAAILFRDGEARLAGPVDLQPARHWTSPTSGVRYPVSWTIALPDLGLKGRVDPLTDDQELPVYGTRATWEGAVRFDGMTGGAPIDGAGRLELAGYASPLTFGKYLGIQLRRQLGRFSSERSCHRG